MSKTTKNALTINDAIEAAAAIKVCHEIDQDLEYWAQCEARAIQKVRDKFEQKRAEGDAQDLVKKRTVLVTALKAWSEKNRKHWGKKSFETDYGTLAFHAGQPKVCLIRKISKSFEDALARITLLKNGKRFVRVKNELNKDQVLAEHASKEITDEELAEAGLKVDQEESFTVKTTASEEIKKRLEARKS